MHTRQQQVDDAEKAFAEDKTTSENNDGSLAAPFPFAPPETDEPANGAGECKGGSVVHA